MDWASLIFGSKITVFALFYFVFEGNIPSTSPRGAYIWRSDLTESFLRYEIGELVFGGAYTWRGLFSAFYGISLLWILQLVMYFLPYERKSKNGLGFSIPRSGFRISIYC